MAPAKVDTSNPNLGKYGATVIGEEQFAAEQKAEKEGEVKFGPDVLDHPTKEGRPPTLEEETRANDPRGAAKNAPAENPTGIPEPAENVDYVSMPLRGKGDQIGLYDVLTDNPALTERIFDIETARPDGARKGALEKVHEVESSKENPDKELLEEVEAALAAWEE